MVLPPPFHKCLFWPNKPPLKRILLLQTFSLISINSQPVFLKLASQSYMKKIWHFFMQGLVHITSRSVVFQKSVLVRGARSHPPRQRR